MRPSRCFSTLGCGELTLEDARALAHRFQLDGIEVRALERTTDVVAVLKRRYGTPDALARLIATDGLPPILAFDTSLKLAGATADDRANLLAFVPWAEALGVARLRVFDGGAPDDAADLAAAADTFAWWRAERARAGWRCDLMVETHDSLLTGEAIARFLARTENASILWDSHHTWRRGGEAPRATWDRIGSAVVHVHVKDSRTTPDGFRYVAPGTGEFPMDDLRRLLAAASFPGTLSLEWERWWIPALAPLAEALQSAQAATWW